MNVEDQLWRNRPGRTWVQAFGIRDALQLHRARSMHARPWALVFTWASTITLSILGFGSHPQAISLCLAVFFLMALRSPALPGRSGFEYAGPRLALQRNLQTVRLQHGGAHCDQPLQASRSVTGARAQLRQPCDCPGGSKLRGRESRASHNKWFRVSCFCSIGVQFRGKGASGHGT